jgi:aspartate-semialdehyde dehydrogenase
LNRIALVGAETLLAREFRDLLAQRKPAPRLELLTGREEKVALISEQEGEAVAMAGLEEHSLDGVELALLAGSPPTSRKALRLARKSGSLLVDLTGALEEQPAARLRAPLVETEPVALTAERIHVIAHPAAIALTLFFSRLDACGPIRRAIVHVFEPASERGQAGIDELQKQSIALLNFQQMPRDIYDAQVGFNLLARYGSEAYEPLEDIEQRIDRHLASLLGPWPRIPLPSLKLIQAPVFHGYSFSLWVEFAESRSREDLAGALASAQIEVRSGEEEAPTNVGAAGQAGVTVGVIEPDRNDSRSWWFWMVADNLRLSAENALAVLREEML